MTIEVEHTRVRVGDGADAEEFEGYLAVIDDGPWGFAESEEEAVKLARQSAVRHFGYPEEFEEG